MNSLTTQQTIRQDAETVRKVRKGDKSAYIDLVYRYQNRLRSVLSFYCHSVEEIEEYTQEAFVEAYTHLDQFKPDLPFFPWLRSIAVNALRLELRRKETDRRLGMEYLERLQMSRVKSKDAEEQEERQLSALDHCMQSLSETNVRLIRKKYRKKCSYTDLAEITGAKENALRVRLMRIRESLRKCIEKYIKSAGKTEV